MAVRTARWEKPRASRKRACFARPAGSTATAHFDQRLDPVAGAPGRKEFQDDRHGLARDRFVDPGIGGNLGDQFIHVLSSPLWLW